MDWNGFEWIDLVENQVALVIKLVSMVNGLCANQSVSDTELDLSVFNINPVAIDAPI